MFQFLSVILGLFGGSVFAQKQLGGTGPGPMAAESPLTDDMVAVLLQGMLIGILVVVLLVGAFLILNLGLLSKRAEDRVGGRTPSDLGLLKSNVWPEAPYEQDQLPAASDDQKAS